MDVLWWLVAWVVMLWHRVEEELKVLCKNGGERAQERERAGEITLQPHIDQILFYGAFQIESRLYEGWK